MKARVVTAILILCACVAQAQQPSSAPTQNKKQASNPPPVATTDTSTKKVRVDRKGFDLDPKKIDRTTQLGAGSRGGPASSAVLYAPNLGLTYTLHPVFFWATEQGARKLTFRLFDSEDNELYEAEISGQSSFTYPENAPKLDPGGTYSWTIQTQRVQLSEPPEPARFMVLSGPERQEVEQALQKFAGNTMQQRIQQAQVFADHWLWYDAVAAYTELISAYPDQPSLYQYRGHIYNDLPQTHELAQQDFARAGERLAGKGDKQR